MFFFLAQKLVTDKIIFTLRENIDFYISFTKNWRELNWIFPAVIFTFQYHMKKYLRNLSKVNIKTVYEKKNRSDTTTLLYNKLITTQNKKNIYKHSNLISHLFSTKERKKHRANQKKALSKRFASLLLEFYNYYSRVTFWWVKCNTRLNYSKVVRCFHANVNNFTLSVRVNINKKNCKSTER